MAEAVQYQASSHLDFIQLCLMVSDISIPSAKQRPTGLKVARHHHHPLSNVSVKPTRHDRGKIPVENSKYSYSQFVVVEIVEVQGPK